MDLILWRHAEAEEAGLEQADLRRRLTRRGERQARQMGGWLLRHMPQKTRVLASPADRTQMTAQALGMKFEVSKKIGIEAGAADILAAAGWPDGEGAVLIVGHQPSLGRVAALLLAGEEADWAVRKGGVWWFTRRVRDGRTQIALRAVVNPELL